MDVLLLFIQIGGAALAVLAVGCEGRGVMEEGRLAAVLPVLEEGESDAQKIERLEREKEGPVREREALEGKGAAEG